MQIATKTMEALTQALEADKCAQFRQNLKVLLPKMEDAYRGEETPFRSHQGASGLGRKCGREVQLGWKWATKPNFPERVLRLFNRGHLEEARFLAMLQCLPNVKLWFETDDGGQFKFNDFGGHYGSALDGIMLGCPDLPEGAPCYTEFKTASDKKFKEFVKDGCEKWNQAYFVQCQQCMHYYKLPYTLFMVVNKNTDDIYAEIIPYEEPNALRYKQRAEQIIFTTDPLPRISNQSTFWECKFCDHKKVCFGKQCPEINCRTCAHWSPKRDGGYHCAQGNSDFANDKHSSFSGCEKHVYDPTLLPQYSFMGGNHESNYTVLRTTKGTEFKQGPEHVTSAQLKEGFNPDKGK